MDRMDIYIKKEEMNKLIKEYLLTDGKEIIFNIFSEYNQSLKAKLTLEKEFERKDENLKTDFSYKNFENAITKEKLVAYFEDIKEIIDIDKEETEEMALKKIKKLIITLFNLNAEMKELNGELEAKNDRYLQSIRELEMKKENLDKKIKILQIEYNEFEEKITNLNNEKLIAEKFIKEKEIINQSLKAEKEKLESNNLVISKKAEELKSKIENLEINIENKLREIKNLEIEKENLNKRIYKLDGIEVLQKLYENYLGISNDYREKLKNLIKSEDVSSFISCCYNIGTMDDLWDSLNIEVRNGNTRDAYILREIFEYFIIQQNKKYDESLYKLIVPEVGEEFDPTKHISIDGNSSGKIEEVVFPGYGIMETKSTIDQEDSERKIRKIRKLAIVKVR